MSQRDNPHFPTCLGKILHVGENLGNEEGNGQWKDRKGPRGRLLELAQERRASLASLSELLGRNASYLQQFIKKGSPKKLEEGDRKTLAAILWNR